MFEANMRLILASGSPRRVDLIGSLGVVFDVHPAECVEPQPEPGEDPSGYAVRAARSKAENVAQQFPHAVIIGADTVVTIDGEILGKPRDREHAVEMLTKLAGRKHSVITGCSLVGPSWKKSEFYISTQVEFIDATPETLRAYVATGETDDKAGAYAIQGVGSFLVRNVCGSYSNVVGLPLARVVEILLGWGVIAPTKS